MYPHSFFRIWCALFLPLFIVASALLLIVYVNDQQTIRLAGNEPQEWMAHDAAQKIVAGIAPAVALTGVPVSVMTDDAPYLIAYNSEGSTTAATGLFDGKVSVLPRGVLEYALEHGTHRLTWELTPGVRHAIVVVPIQEGKIGYVLAGRSTSYTEEQETLLANRTVFGWLILLFLSFIICAVASLLLRNKKQ